MTRRNFLIVCSCGHTFWRAHPCHPNLRTWTCPRNRSGLTRHDTRLSTLTEQMTALHRERMAAAK